MKRATRKYASTILGVCLSLSLSSCVTELGGAPDGSEENMMAPPSWAGAWALARVNGKSLRNGGFSLVFNHQRGVTGTVKCNNFSGQFVLVPEGIRFADITSTLLGCEGFDPLVDEASEIVFSNNSIGRLSRDNRELTFRARDGGSASFARRSKL